MTNICKSGRFSHNLLAEMLLNLLMLFKYALYCFCRIKFIYVFTQWRHETCFFLEKYMKILDLI